MPIEDFTTYTAEEQAGGGTATVTDANTITWASLQRGEGETRIYSDKGAGYFSGDFTHKFEFVTNTAATTQDGAWVYTWMLSNAIGSPGDIETAGGDYLGFYFVNGAGDVPRFDLRISDDGTPTSDTSSTIAWSTRYYITITRDDDGGVNGTGRLTAYICTVNYNGGAGSVLFDTLIVDCGAGEQNDYRYIFATVPRGGISTAATHGLVENFDLGVAFVELAGTIAITISMTGALTAGEIAELAGTIELAIGLSGTLTAPYPTGVPSERYTRVKLIVLGTDALWYQT